MRCDISTDSDIDMAEAIVRAYLRPVKVGERIAAAFLATSAGYDDADGYRPRASVRREVMPLGDLYERSARLGALLDRRPDWGPGVSLRSISIMVAVGLQRAGFTGTEAALEAAEAAARPNSLISDFFAKELRGTTWNALGISIRISVALTASRLLGGTAAQTRNSLALSCAAAGGFASGFASELVLPLTVRDGISNAFLARKGFTGALHPIMGRRGLLAVMAPDAEPGPIQELGARLREI